MASSSSSSLNGDNVMRWTVSAASAAVALSLVYRTLSASTLTRQRLRAALLPSSSSSTTNTSASTTTSGTDKDIDAGVEGDTEFQDEPSLEDTLEMDALTAANGGIPPWTVPLSHTRIIVASTSAECDAAIGELMAHQPSVIGVDGEWVKDSIHSMALLQISSGWVTVLIRLHMLDIRNIPRLTALLTNAHILKVGVGISVDAHRLQATLGCQLTGWIELANLLPLIPGLVRHLGSKRSLKSFTKSLLGIELEKRRSLTCSNWEATTLAQEQIQYAAADAFYGLILFRVMTALRSVKIPPPSAATVTAATNGDSKEEKKVPTSSPSLERHASVAALVGLPGVVYEWSRWPSLTSSASHTVIADAFANNDTWSPLPDTIRLSAQYAPYVNMAVHKQGHAAASSSSTAPGKKTKGVDKTTQAGYQRRQAASVTKHVYENCKMLAPDGTEMAAINNKKIKWYTDRGLATLVSNDPPTIQLKFLPKGYGAAQEGIDEQTRKFYLSDAKNECVVCGAAESFRRHNIVPTTYRRYFPVQFKNHSSHDVVLLCVPCHLKAEAMAQLLMSEIAKETGFPLPGSVEARAQVDNSLYQVQKAAAALQFHHGALPERRRRELKVLIAKWACIPVTDVTDEVIQRAHDIDPKSPGAPSSEYKAPTSSSSSGAASSSPATPPPAGPQWLRPVSSNASHYEKVIALLDETAITAFCARWRHNFVDRMQPKHLSPFWSVDHTRVMPSDRPRHWAPEEAAANGTASASADSSATATSSETLVDDAQ